MVALPDKISHSGAVLVSSAPNVGLFRKAVIFEVLKVRRRVLEAQEVSADLLASENQRFRAQDDESATTKVVRVRNS